MNNTEDRIFLALCSAQTDYGKPVLAISGFWGQPNDAIKLALLEEDKSEDAQDPVEVGRTE